MEKPSIKKVKEKVYMNEIKEEHEHPYNGKIVHDDARCVLCGKGPKPGERFGCEEKDWDAPGMICPRCFP